MAPMFNEIPLVAFESGYLLKCPRCHQDIDSVIYDEHMEGHDPEGAEDDEDFSSTPQAGNTFLIVGC